MPSGSLKKYGVADSNSNALIIILLKIKSRWKPVEVGLSMCMTNTVNKTTMILTSVLVVSYLETLNLRTKLYFFHKIVRLYNCYGSV